jgi:hypothetical protein
VQLDRDALSVEADRTCADVLARSIEKAHSDGAPGRARLLVGDGRKGYVAALLEKFGAASRLQPSPSPVAGA